MATIIKCKKCGHEFPSGVQVSGNVSYSGNVSQSGACPKCGTEYSAPLG